MRFSIRDLLWLTILAGTIIGWWLTRKQALLDIAHHELEVERLTLENEMLRSCHTKMTEIYERDTGRTISFPLPEVVSIERVGSLK